VRIITTMARIPSATPPDEVARAEQTLAHTARRFDPAALARIAERLLAHLDPTAPHPPTNPNASASSTCTPAATARPSPGASTPTAAPASRKSSTPSTLPPDTDGQPDQRSQPRRNADALIEAMTRILDDGDRQVYLTFLADALARPGKQRDLDAAARLGMQSIDLAESLDSTRGADRIRDLCYRMKPHASLPVVRDFLERASAFS
jgi:hypothetical protein